MTVRSILPALSVIHFEQNNVTFVSSENGGRYEYEFDELDRPRAQAWTYEGRRYVTDLHYATSGCLDSATYPTGASLTMTCDSANRVTNVLLNGEPLVTDIAYHPSGQVAAMTYGNGRTTAVVYDARGRAREVNAPGVSELRYTYDGASNVRSFEDQVIPGSLRTMTYDSADRLTAVTAQSLWGIATYSYDALGNRMSASSGGRSAWFAYDDHNRLNAVTGTFPLPAPKILTWDAASRLVASSVGSERATYRYDGHDRRVEKAVGTSRTVYHYGPSGQLIAETLPDGTKIREYFYLGNKLIAVDGCAEGAPPQCVATREWYHTDSLGSMSARTDESGTVVARLDYEAWGEVWSQSGTPGDRQYNGRVYDPGTGFHDYGARMYWPQIGRFISADSYQGDPANPASLNRYSYVHNNPYKYVDPTGHWGEDVHRDATRGWALEMGFSGAQAGWIALADAGVDDVANGSSPYPVVGRQGYHFNTNGEGQPDSRTQNFEAGLAVAIRYGRASAYWQSIADADPGNMYAKEMAGNFNAFAMEALGQILHPLQDSFAHVAPYVKEDSAMGVKYKYHDSPQYNGKPNGADNTHGKTDPRYKQTEQATKDALQRYKAGVAEK